MRCGGLGVETIQGDGPALIPSGTVPDGFEWLQERLDHLELRVAVLEAVKEVAEPGGEPCNSQDSGDIVRRRARRRNCSSMSALDDVQSVCKVTSLMSRQTASQLTQGQLDVSDMCTIKESVWDAGLFVGLRCCRATTFFIESGPYSKKSQVSVDARRPHVHWKYCISADGANILFEHRAADGSDLDRLLHHGARPVGL